MTLGSGLSPGSGHHDGQLGQAPASLPALGAQCHLLPSASWARGTPPNACPGSSTSWPVDITCLCAVLFGVLFPLHPTKL